MTVGLYEVIKFEMGETKAIGVGASINDTESSHDILLYRWSPTKFMYMEGLCKGPKKRCIVDKPVFGPHYPDATISFDDAQMKFDMCEPQIVDVGQEVKLLTDDFRATSAESAGCEKRFQEWFEKFEPRFSEKLFEMEDDWKGLAKKMLESKVEKIYVLKACGYNVEKYGVYDVIYESDSRYVAIDNNEISHEVMKEEPIIHNGDFKNVFLNQTNGWNPYVYFTSEELMNEYLESCNKYMKLWRLEESIKNRKIRIDDILKTVVDEKKKLAEMNEELDKIRAEMM